MADGMALPRVITNELLHCEQNALRAYEGKFSELIPPGPWSCESVQFNWIRYVLHTAQNVTYLLF